MGFLDGKRALVTAGCDGIGRVIAETLAGEGARVHVCDVSEAAIARCRGERPDFGVTPCDVGEIAQVDRLFEEALESLGGLDILVNNAGIAGPTAPIDEISPEDWCRTINIDLNSFYYCCRRAVPLLRNQKSGAIINLSSSAGLFGFPFRTPYAAAKWAVIGLTKSLAMELGPDGIRVNAICPGAVSGARMDRVIAADAANRGIGEDQVHREILKQVSLRTFVTAQDIASMALFICSPAGDKISGQSLAVDGHTESLSKLD